MMHPSGLYPAEQSVAGKACPAAVSLASVANRSFATDADGRGWTDQGPENDLRMFHREFQEGKPFRFEILPDGEAQCLVLSRKFPDFLPEAEVCMPSEPHGEGDIAVELWKKLELGENDAVGRSS